jgi:superfamily II DNA or RNA helicase
MNIGSILLKCNNWQDFRSHLQSLTEKQKGNCFESLTKYFLQLHPEYITVLKNVWYLEEVPPEVKKLLNLPEPDEGIDLVAETKDGKYWAIQCKFRENENKSLSRRELSTFTDLSFNICKHINFGLVCTNADRFSHKLTLYGERLSFCSSEMWRALDKEFFKRLHELLVGKIVPIKPVKPLTHQVKAIQNAFEHFINKNNGRGKLISPCGTGKSLTGYWIYEKLGGERILVAVPSLALIRQTLQVWTRESVANKKDIHWIAVCSDESVGDIDRDDIAILTQDLGIRVHTDPEEIAEWLRSREKDSTVIFTTYQSSKATAEAAKKSNTTFDVGIFDEAHKTVGKKDSLFSYLLHDENIRIKKRIFMTATERHYRGQSNDIVSMDNPEIYGDTFELLSFKKALETRPPILSDYKIVTISVTQNEIASLIRKNLFVRPDKGKWDTEVETEMLAAVIALRKAMKKYPIQHAVSFHSSIARAKAFKLTQDNFSKTFSEYGRLETFHVSGNIPTSVRSRELDEFSQSMQGLVTNVRCLTEGVDVPNIDCVLFADPKRSTIDIVQAVGRALRTYEGKKLGYVVVPVLLESDATDIKSQYGRAFDNIIMVLRALTSNDERIIEYFRTVSQGRKWRDTTTPIEIDIPEGLPIDAEEFIKSINLQCWSRLAKLSWRPFEEARAFVRSLKLKSVNEWQRYCIGKLTLKKEKPKDIPSAPPLIYKYQGWLNWGDWLGTGTIATHLREYRPFKAARAFVHSLGLKGESEWRKYYKGQLSGKKKPTDIPSDPHHVYKNKGWISMGDWLGTGYIAAQLREYRPFKEACAFTHRLGLKNNDEWRRYCKGELREKGKKPNDIPFNPDHVYKDKGWISWGDWLGTGTVATYFLEYRPFKEARVFVRRLGLKSISEWRKYCKGELKGKDKKPDDIPANPSKTYKNKGWISMGDWLGTGIVATHLREYRPFQKARAFARRLGLKSGAEWKKYCKGKLEGKEKKPENIPANPYQTYKNKGWINLGDWLGTNTIATFLRKYRPF